MRTLAGGKHESLAHYYFHFDLIDSRTGKRIPARRLSHLPLCLDAPDILFFENCCKRILAASLMNLDENGPIRRTGQELANSVFRGLLLEIELDV